VELKPKKDWKLIASPCGGWTRRRRLPEGAVRHRRASAGNATALVARSPSLRKVKSFDASKARAVPGVEQVVQVPSGIAVVATNFWSAKLGRDALQIDWDLGAGAELDTGKLLRRTRTRQGARHVGGGQGRRGRRAGRRGPTSRGRIRRALPGARDHGAAQLHVRLEGGRCEIWTGTQFHGVDQMAAAQVAGVPPQNVIIHTPFLAAVRRRATLDSTSCEGVHVAKAAGVPVKVVWTREDDIRGGTTGHVRAPHRGRGGREGLPQAWRHTVVGQSILTAPCSRSSRSRMVWTPSR